MSRARPLRDESSHMVGEAVDLDGGPVRDEAELDDGRFQSVAGMPQSGPVILTSRAVAGEGEHQGDGLQRIRQG